jgi:phage portal protein BeeE
MRAKGRQVANVTPQMIAAARQALRDFHAKNPMFQRGVNSKNAKLDDDKVRYIRSRKESQRAMAKRFGVTESVISDVVNYKTWTHVHD